MIRHPQSLHVRRTILSVSPSPPVLCPAAVDSADKAPGSPRFKVRVGQSKTTNTLPNGCGCQGGIQAPSEDMLVALGFIGNFSRSEW